MSFNIRVLFANKSNFFFVNSSLVHVVYLHHRCFWVLLLQIRLQEEHERCLIYLDASTRKPLIATAEKQLLERHIPAILDKVLITSTTRF